MFILEVLLVVVRRMLQNMFWMSSIGRIRSLPAHVLQALPVPFMARSLPARSIHLLELDIVEEPKNSSYTMCWPIRNAATDGD